MSFSSLDYRMSKRSKLKINEKETKAEQNDNHKKSENKGKTFACHPRASLQRL